MYNASYFSFSENSDTDSKGVFVEFETFFFSFSDKQLMLQPFLKQYLKKLQNETYL